jgi:hypothetical protein
VNSEPVLSESLVQSLTWETRKILGEKEPTPDELERAVREACRDYSERLARLVLERMRIAFS